MNEPNLSFYHAKLKVRWAKILIDELDRIQKEFLASNKYDISIQYNPKHRTNIFVVGNIPIPIEFPCLIGDICHNLRASADFCWMGLHRSVHNDPKAKHTLPISNNAKGLKSTAAKVFDGETGDNIGAFLTDVIKTHHDYEGGGNRIFCILNELSNWQKHNMLIPTLMVTKLGKNSVIKSSNGGMISCEGARITNNSVPFAIDGNIVEFTYDTEPTLEIGINIQKLGGSQPIISTLLNFHQCVADIVDAFNSSFCVSN